MDRRLRYLMGLALLAGVVAVNAAETVAAPGRLYSLGTHHLHLYCRGQGAPTVIFESGLGGVGLEWMGVLERVSRQSRACYYDRAGYGWSEAGPMPRTASREANELAELLDVAGIHGRLLLVAHSYGGYVVQVFARARPERIAGLVLVDASHSAQLTRFPVARGRYCPALDRGLPLRMTLDPRLPPGLPAEHRRTMLTLMLRDTAARAQLSELCHFAGSAAAAGAGGRPFPQVPLVVVSRGRAEFPATARGREQETDWATLQGDLSRLVGGALHVIGRHSGHHVHLDQPALVASATINSVMLARSAVGDGYHRRFAGQN